MYKPYARGKIFVPLYRDFYFSKALDDFTASEREVILYWQFKLAQVTQFGTFPKAVPFSAKDCPRVSLDTWRRAMRKGEGVLWHRVQVGNGRAKSHFVPLHEGVQIYPPGGAKLPGQGGANLPPPEGTSYSNHRDTLMPPSSSPANAPTADRVLRLLDPNYDPAKSRDRGMMKRFLDGRDKDTAIAIAARLSEEDGSVVDFYREMTKRCPLPPSA